MSEELRFLSHSECRIVDAIAQAIYPADRVFGDAVGELLDAAHTDVAKHFDEIMSRSPKPVRWLIKLYLHYVNWLPILTFKHLRRLVKLTPEQAEQVFIGRYKSGNYIVRGGVLLLKVFLGLAYYTRPQVKRALKVKPSCEPGKDISVDWGEEPIGFSRLTDDVNEECDVCVVGSGAGGGVVADELAELGKRVIVVEEGPYVSPRDYKAEWHDAMMQLYRQNGTMGSVGKPFIPVQAGRCLGGTTVINAAICFRLPESALEDWQADYGVEVEYSELASSFERVEKKAGVRPVEDKYLGNNNLLFKKGCDALGISSNPIRRNEIGCKGCAVCPSGCPEGAKQSTDISYLPRATRHGARIYVNSRAERILTSGSEVRGVEATILDPIDRPAHKLRVRAKSVVICCGALYSPLVLLKNKLVKSSPNVGRNFINQIGCGLVGIFDEEVNQLFGANQGYESSEYLGQGVILETVAGPPEMVQLRAGGVGVRHMEYMRHFINMAFFGALIKTTSRGVLRPQPGSWEPMILYALNDEDVRTTRFGLEKIAEVMFAAGARKVITGVHGLPMELVKPEDVRIIREAEIKNTHLNVIGNHPLGTCMMGADPKRAVVSGLRDNFLEVFDVKNLYVCDASIFPTALGVNPMLSIMAFADYFAHLLADRL